MKITKILHGSIVLFWVVLPFAHFPFVLFQLSQNMARVSSFTGNPILLAGECLFSLTVGLWMFHKTQDLFFLVSAAISLFCIIFTVVHAAYLGLFIGLIIAFYGFLTLKRTI